MEKKTELIVLGENDSSEVVRTLEGILYDIPYSPEIRRFVIEIDDRWFTPVDVADVIEKDRIVRVVYLEAVGPREFTLR